MNKNRNIEAIYPLTPVQAGIMYHALSAVSVGMYFDQLHCVLQGELDIDAFQQAWKQVISRHMVLRSAFVWERTGEPLQIVYKQVALPWQELDWRGFSSDEQQQRLQEFLVQERAQGLNWKSAPLLRLTLIHLADRFYHFVWSIHHILIDGWSHSLLLAELFRCYRAYVKGVAPVLPPTRPYQDYVRWQKQQDLSVAKQFWQEHLQGFTAPTPLTVDRDYSLQVSDNVLCDVQEYWLMEATTSALQAFARQHQLTLNTLAQAAWAILLSWYSGEEDVVFGVTSHGRPSTLAGFETMIGIFINTLPMRVRVNAGERLLPWLKNIHSLQSKVFSYDYVPLPQIQAWSSLPRGIAPFESIIVFENYPITAAVEEQEDQVRILHVQATPEQRNYPLVLGLAVLPGPSLRLHLSYRRDRFDEPTIMLMLQHYHTLLEAIVVKPEASLEMLSPLTKVERTLLLDTRNAYSINYPSQKSVQTLFELQVALAPDALALVFEDEQLTYAMLNERSNQLAHYLQMLGVGPEIPVVLCMERSIEMVVGLFGIVKAGGVYVPLDSEYPQERLIFVLDDIQAPILLTQQHIQRRLPALVEQFVFCLDSNWDFVDQESTENPQDNNVPDNLAYIIYTSGSTGTPKGVMIPHKALFNHMCWIQTTFPLSSADRVLQKTSISFDVSVSELFEALLAGGQLILAQSHGQYNTKYLVELIMERAVTVAHFAPSLLQSLLELRELQNCSSLCCIYCGAESLSYKLLQQIRDELLAEVHNLYGPTETCITSIALPAINLTDKQEVSIGLPIAHTQVYLLDRYMRPVPLGGSGEVYIGGYGLARGYMNAPDLTVERFIPDPFSCRAGARLYRTGDIACNLPDGNIQFVGRSDRQIKIRGYRIELDEIEIVLKSIQGVHTCAVMAWEEATLEKYIVAYIVSEQHNTITNDEIRQAAQKTLPTYMLPSMFIPLDALPLTSSGKIDRRALPPPEKRQSETEKALMLPQTPIEELLVNIWKQVLAIDIVSVQDNFFDLGGHSLLATQVISRIHETLHLDVSIGDILTNSTIVELAAKLHAALQEEHRLEFVPLILQERPESLPLSFAQQRLWFLDQLAPGNSFYSMPMAVQLFERLDLVSFERSLAEVVRRHETLRTSIIERDGYLTQLIAPDLTVSVPVIDFQALPSDVRQEQARYLISQAFSRPFELSRAPLLRVTLLRMAEQEHVLLLVMHHIISDGWSVNVLIHELTMLYAAFTDQRPSPLPDLPIQYADFALWQRQWLSGKVLEQQLAYWREQLSDIPSLQLPTDHPRPLIERFRGTHISFQFSPSLSQQLQAFSRQEGVTLYMTLLTAFEVLLWRYSGQEDLVVGMPVANRTRKEIETLIGFFVNTLVLRVQLGGDLSVRMLLQHVREKTLEAHTYQDVPFEYIVEQLQPERSVDRNPLIQVTFMLLNTPHIEQNTAHLSLVPLSTENFNVKFDLSLSLLETADGLSGSWAYSTDLFEEETIQRMHAHWERILEGMIANPRLRLVDLPLLTPNEELQILHNWNATHMDFPQTHCLPLLVEQQVERTPDAVAAIFEDQILTYRMLDQQANQWSYRLQRQGVGAESLVGVCMSRSLEMLIAVLAILKAGGAYVPLDPTQPPKRLRMMIQDAQLSVIVSQVGWSATIAPLVPIVLYLDTLAFPLSTAASIPLVRHMHPDNLAYVIYTSGSTGTPKGVMVSHRGICNRLFWAQRVYQMTSQDSILQKSPLTFDISIEEFFWPLLVGAHTVIARPEGHRDSEYLVHTIVEQQVTMLRLVTPHLTVLAETAGLEACSSLRLLICGGETLVQEVVQRVYARLSTKVVLHNFYGATEASVDSTFWECGSEQERGVVPIGRPMDNVVMYVLDTCLQPVPVGVAGELYIGGISLARGYLRQPALTAERFVPDPYCETVGGRLYRTGDQGRYLPDGTLEFIGRTDTQVKIRGYRIELGEIEAVLMEHPGVQDAVVIVRENRQGDKQLVSYVTQNPDWHAEREDVSDTELQREHTENWQLIFDETYRQDLSHNDPMLNFSGWNSSYTGASLSDLEMHEWLEQGLKRISALPTSRVLEIGCGTGLLLLHIAPQVSYYCGTDFSLSALEYVQQQLGEAGNELSHVELRQQYADDFTGLPARSFDTIILNSVVQYFSGIDYLLRVLEGAFQVVAPGGCIFIGDVRNLPLLPAFHTAVVLERASPWLSCIQLKQQVTNRLFQEKELVIDPAFFVALQHLYPQISHVQIEPEHGKYQNELTQFRYNVSIYVTEKCPSPRPIPWQEWSDGQFTLPALRSLLTEQRPTIIGIQQVPNARVQRYTTAASMLVNQEMPATTEDLRRLLEEQELGIDPEQLWELADETSYAVDISWSHGYPDGSFDVVLRDAKLTEEQEVLFPASDGFSLRPWSSYANKPQSRKAAQALVTHVQQWLFDRLPDYMVPTSLTILEELPLTANGKFDRQALPAFQGERPELEEVFVVPHTSIEVQLAVIWAQVLGIEQIGTRDNFFALGGHSLLATQVISRINEAFEIELPLSVLFQRPTIAELAEQIMQSTFELEDDALLEQLLATVEKEEEYSGIVDAER